LYGELGKTCWCSHSQTLARLLSLIPTIAYRKLTYLGGIALIYKDSIYLIMSEALVNISSFPKFAGQTLIRIWNSLVLLPGIAYNYEDMANIVESINTFFADLTTAFYNI
jgi:hypothetical protein